MTPCQSKTSVVFCVSYGISRPLGLELEGPRLPFCKVAVLHLLGHSLDFGLPSVAILPWVCRKRRKHLLSPRGRSIAEIQGYLDPQFPRLTIYNTHKLMKSRCDVANGNDFVGFISNGWDFVGFFPMTDLLRSCCRDTGTTRRFTHSVTHKGKQEAPSDCGLICDRCDFVGFICDICDIVGFICGRCDFVSFIWDRWNFMGLFAADGFLWALFARDWILWVLFGTDGILWAFCDGWYFVSFICDRLCGLYLPQMVFCGLFSWLTSSIPVAEIREPPDVS